MVSCTQTSNKANSENNCNSDPEYFLLRPEVEKAYGYSNAVKICNQIKISGAVSMDNEGSPTAVGNLEQQMKNCYSDLQKILEHFNSSFDDVVVENIFTTDMGKFLEVASYRNDIYGEMKFMLEANISIISSSSLVSDAKKRIHSDLINAEFARA